MKFNPARLALARRRRLLKKKELAELIGVEPHTVVRWEGNFTETPTRENFDALVKVLEYPESFFFGPDIDELNSETTSFRSQTSMSASIRDAAFAAGSIGFLISDWIEAKFDLPKVQIPDLHLYQSNPEDAAQVVRQEWGCGEKPISNMIHLLESKGVRVFSLAENTTKVNAFSVWRGGKPYVFLNNYKTAESSRFDAAHELAHLVLHQDGGVVGRRAELQAHAFASALLMPKADVLSQVPRVYALSQLSSAKKRWRVSLAALNHRVHRLGLTSEWKYRDFCIEMSSKGYHKSEPNGIEREKSKVWDMVLKELWSDGVTQKIIAQELSLPEAELNDLLFGVLSSEPKAAIKDRPLLSLFTEEG